MKIARAALLLLLIAAPLHAAENAPASGAWTLGANFGVSYLKLAGDNHFVGFNVPQGAGLFSATLQPGMRVGYATASGTSDIYLDLGINYASYGDGDSYHSYIITGNYQFNFSPMEPTSLYGTLGGGFHNIGGSGDSQTDPLFGLGLGMRHKVSEGHGAVRGELRYDRLNASDDEAIDSFSLKVGVDLWIR
jgi:hypothetical protein